MVESNYQREKRLLFEFLKTVEVAPQTVSSTGGTSSGGAASTETISTIDAPTKEELENAKTQIYLLRLLDDGRQTLGLMQVYDKSGKELFELKSVELPYLDNQNSISCVPEGKYLVRPRANSHYGKHFHLVGSEAGEYKIIPNNKKTNREWVLIHKAPNSTWLAGCIGPGTEFNSNITGREIKDKYGAGGRAGNKQGNPYGMISKNDSINAMKKLTDTLWKTPVKENSFYMTIKNASTGLLSQLSPETLNKTRIGETTDPVV